MSQRLLIALLAIFACADVGLAQAPKKYALLIGVTKYDHAAMSPLQFPEEDAKALGDLLKSGGYEVETLLGSKATQKAIRERLGGLNKKGNAEGVVLIGLFGHGVEITVRNAKNEIVRDETGKEVTEGCFCPFDTEVRLVRDSKGNPLSGLTEPDPGTLIKLAELMTSLKVAKAGSRVIFVDCCREVPNEARSAGRSFGASFQAKDLPQNTSVLFGCSPREQAFENPDWGHGAFTKCLLEELPRLSAEGEVETGILAARLKKKVPQLVASVSRKTQTPVNFSTDTVDLQLGGLTSTMSTSPPSSSTKPKPPSQPTKPETTSRGMEGSKEGEAREFAQGIVFHWCPPGSFMMGSPKTETGRDSDEDQVNVTLTKGFWLGETELTQGQWQKLMGTTPWSGQTYVKEGADYPATYISHDDAVSYCQKLTNQERSSNRLPKGWKYSLPTEAQWEYACRAKTKSAYSFGENAASLGDYGWFKDNADKIKEEYAHRVGQKKPNPWGLKDMHGNVREWCSDWDGSLTGGVDPVGASSGSYRVNRGGSWGNEAAYCRSAYRSSNSPDLRSSNLGFRLAVVPE